jgi:hypothetical protein
MTLTQHSTDHETALAGGFDIVEAGRWVRPDNASIVRSDIAPRYRATRDYGPTPWVAFYTMREAVEWIGPTGIEEAEPTCDICDRSQDDSPAGFAIDWNPETGNHATCEELAEERYAYQRDNGL